MKTSLKLRGATDTVTGSQTFVRYRGYTRLVDCGLFQGPKLLRERNWAKFEIAPETIESVILTHAHLDHSGYLPRLCKTGFTGPIRCTPGTADLLRILLMDAAFLEEESARYANESGYSSHKPALPLFTSEDAERALAQVEVRARDEWHALDGGIGFRFLRAGHIIGASLVQFSLEIGDEHRIVTFSGDLGHDRSFIMRGPETGFETDVLILESTYGDRLHPRTDPLDELARIATRTFGRGGALVVPAFAVGRAQEITYMIRLLEDQGRIPRVPVILDSPMAASATEICLRHPEDQILNSGFLGTGDPFRPHRFEVAETPDQSMLACMRDGPLVVISASGMLSGGRILHHLKHRLPDPRNTVLFSGYQAEGTKGRFLQENATKAGEIRIHHEPVPIAAEVATLDVLSAHADSIDLLAWIGRLRRLPKLVVTNHGAPASQRALAAAITERFGIAARAACDGETLEIT